MKKLFLSSFCCGQEMSIANNYYLKQHVLNFWPVWVIKDVFHACLFFFWPNPSLFEFLAFHLSLKSCKYLCFPKLIKYLILGILATKIHKQPHKGDWPQAFPLRTVVVTNIFMWTIKKGKDTVECFPDISPNTDLLLHKVGTKDCYICLIYHCCLCSDLCTSFWLKTHQKWKRETLCQQTTGDRMIPNINMEMNSASKTLHCETNLFR